VSPGFSPNTDQCYNQSDADSTGCSLYASSAQASNTGIAAVPFRNQPELEIVVADTLLPFRHGRGLFFTASLITTTNNTAIGNGLLGNFSVQASNGMVKFTDLGVNRAGSDFLIRFESAGFPLLYSSTFHVVPGTPVTMDLLQDAANSAAGLALVQQPALSVSDAGGNLVSVASTVSAVLMKGVSRQPLDGSPTARTSSGIARFTDLTVDEAENNFFFRFVVEDRCCGASLSVQGSTFNITTSYAVQLSEIVTPDGGTGGTPFTTQPVVAVLDAGGNLIQDNNGTEVTASLFKDDTIRFSVKQGVAITGVDIEDLTSFVANDTVYVVAAMYYDGNTYSVDSVLFEWDFEAEVVVPIQQLPTSGARAWEHVSFGDDHYLFVANSFEEVSVVNGVILGTYITESQIYKYDSGQLVLVGSFTTEGAYDIESFRVGGETFIVAANNFNDTSTAIQSFVYLFNGTSVEMTPIQTLNTEAATQLHSFTTAAGTFLAVGMYYSQDDISYETQSKLFRFVGDSLEFVTSFSTSGAVSLMSFMVDSRTFLAVANSVDAAGNLDGGSIDIYEFDGGALSLMQTVLGLDGVSAMENFYVNDAQWLAVATNPTSGDSPALVLLTWDVSNCTETYACPVNFTTYDVLAISNCKSVVHFRAGSAHYIVYGGSAGLETISFQSDAILSGTLTASTVNGKAKFTDLMIDLSQTSFVLAYESDGLFTAIGDPFDVGVGPGLALALVQSPSGFFGGAAFGIQPIVGVVDSGGNVVTEYTPPLGTYVTANLTSFGRESALRGTEMVSIQGGLAVFTDLGITAATWNMLEFSAPGFTSTQQNISVEVGTASKLSLRSASALAFGGVLFGNQPVIWVVDMGGNLVSSDQSTQVSASLHPRAGFAVSSANTDFIASSLVSDSVLFIASGSERIVAASESNLTVYQWGCGGPVPVQTVNATGAAVDLSMFNYDGVQWLLAAQSYSSVQVYAYIDEFLLQNASIAGDVEHLMPFQIGGTMFVAVGLSSLSPLQGTILYSWERPDSSVVGSPYNPIITRTQNISVGTTVNAIEHFTFNYKDYLLEGLSTGVLKLYTWKSYDGVFNFNFTESVGQAAVDLEVFYLASGEPMLALADAAGAGMVMPLAHPSSSGNVSLQQNLGSAQSLTLSAGSCTIAHALRGSRHLLAFACSTLHLFEGDGTTFTDLWSEATSYSSVTLGPTALVALGGPAGASGVFLIGATGTLSGTRSITATGGIARFTDLAVDLASSYDLSFAPVSLYLSYVSSETYVTSHTYDYNVSVSLGIPAALAPASQPSVGVSPSIVVVDGGGNNLTSVSVPITAVLDGPSNFTVLEEVQRLSSTGARDVHHFTMDGVHYVAVANNFDGTSFNIDSNILRWSSGALIFHQSLETKGAYDFEAFKMSEQQVTSDGPRNKTYTYFLAVANHYHDTEGYETSSLIYRWNSTLQTFEILQSIVTLGATHWESFELNGEIHLAVSNFFDGSFHSCNSAVYKWSAALGQFALLQELPTTGAHDVAYLEHNGRHFLAFAQYRAEDEISLSEVSLVYKLDARTMQFTRLKSIPSSGAMHIEPFYIGSSAFFAVANYANTTSGNRQVGSFVYQLTCEGDTDVFTKTQSISTEGAVHWKYFQRAGNHYLAVCHWVPDELSANYVVVYLWDSGSFQFYTNTSSLGAFTTEFMFVDGGYYLLEAIPGDPISILNQFVDGSGAPPQVASLDTTNGAATLTAFDEELSAQNYDGSVLNGAAVEFASEGLTGTSIGPYVT